MTFFLVRRHQRTKRTGRFRNEKMVTEPTLVEPFPLPSTAEALPRGSADVPVMPSRGPPLTGKLAHLTSQTLRGLSPRSPHESEDSRPPMSEMSAPSGSVELVIRDLIVAMVSRLREERTNQRPLPRYSE